MKINLSNKNYLMIISFIWIIIGIHCTYLLVVVERNTILFEILFSIIITRLTIINFFRRIKIYGMPFLLDWYLLSSFFYLIYNFLNIADDVTNPKKGVFGLYSINENYTLQTLVVILAGVVTIHVITFLFLVRKSSNKQLKIIAPDLIFKREIVFIFLSFFFLLIQFMLVYVGFVGFGTENFDSENGNKTLLGNSSFIFQIINSLSNSFLYIYSIKIFLNNTKSLLLKNTFKIYMLIYIFITFYGGSKGGIIFLFLFLTVIYLSSGRSIPKNVLIVGSVLLILLYPINSNFRKEIGNNPTGDRSELLIKSITLVFEDNFDETLKSSSGKYSERLAMFPFLTYAVQHEERWDEYKNMTRFLYLPISFVPRGIIPSKPSQDNGIKYNYFINQERWAAQTPTSFGWAYLEGGYLYVVLTFALFSILINYYQFFYNKKNNFFIVFYIYLFMSLLNIEADIYFYLSGVLISAITYFIFCKLLFKSV